METKDAYLKKKETQIKEWDAKLDELRFKSDMAIKSQARIEYTTKIIDLRKKKEEIQRRLKNLRNTSNEAWANLKEELDKSVSELKSSFEETLSKFK